MLRIHDTARGRLVDLEPRDPGKVSMYVCGPTVYDVAHLGHGRHLLVFDVVRRYLEWSGLEVRYVSNVTDIEDKIIAKANATGRSTDEVVATYEAEWWRLVERLGCRRPDEVPHATQYVDEMVTYIQDLIDRGRAYATDDGVYFSVESLEDYGQLARQSLESLREGGGDRDVVGRTNKRSPLDFALWKNAKPGEPSWPSPWADGRPGWHIECTVMALGLLGDAFDLHGGGLDLQFPHHENERAQAVAGGHAFATIWLHHGMVLAPGGQEMHRSAGNFVSLDDLLTRHDPRAYRLLVARSHYRSPMEVSEKNLADATEALRGLDRLVDTVGPTDAQPDAATLQRFRDYMDDDFNTPQAAAILFEARRAANAALDTEDRAHAEALTAALLSISGALGLSLGSVGDTVVDAAAATLAQERDAARAAKDWARADDLRAELEGRGWIIEDTAGGTRLRR
ncbi:MAG: Cysteinyl-tRNA synthetase [uncultured Acidimicrobiales bacterium]|uniref:Cysteine--tRNA ligase n=1 Tax=uncultured Acidimicrobiales bacterium TaxID=310071 RepID=A0A6J4HGS9_9ACTN|nr:MAG: Cysteinyl-tRNA synthetase [uncultured Acidimicrobiales bacterium]